MSKGKVELAWRVGTDPRKDCVAHVVLRREGAIVLDLGAEGKSWWTTGGRYVWFGTQPNFYVLPPMAWTEGQTEEWITSKGARLTKGVLTDRPESLLEHALSHDQASWKFAHDLYTRLTREPSGPKFELYWRWIETKVFIEGRLGEYRPAVSLLTAPRWIGVATAQYFGWDSLNSIPRGRGSRIYTLKTAQKIAKFIGCVWAAYDHA